MTLPIFSLRHLMLLLLLAGGMVLGTFLYQWEHTQVLLYLERNPLAHPPFHQARPILLVILSLLPAVGAFYYAQARVLDRYIFKRYLNSFLVMLSSFLLIWLLLELENTPSSFKKAGVSFTDYLRYYTVQFPYALGLLAPFSLLLSCLFVLGQLSNSREIIGMIQTGRGFLRIIRPILVIGILATLAAGIGRYHWSASGLAHKQGMEDAIEHNTFTTARNILYHAPASQRLWYVGLYPAEAYHGAALLQVEITFPPTDKLPEKRLRVDSANWDGVTGHWTLKGVETLYLAESDTPAVPRREEQLIMTDWEEIPPQMVASGLPAHTLGVPECMDWLHANPAASWMDRQPYRSQFHSNIAHPWICLIAILLAAPLGIVFSRKGTTTGVLSALLLCLLLFFANEIFSTMGANGHLSAVLGAWLGNLIFCGIAAFLIARRISGQPIVQTIKKWMGG